MCLLKIKQNIYHLKAEWWAGKKKRERHSVRRVWWVVGSLNEGRGCLSYELENKRRSWSKSRAHLNLRGLNWIGIDSNKARSMRPIGGCRESHGHHSGIKPSQENRIWLLILVSQSSGRSLIWKDHVIVAANFQGNYLNILSDTQKVYDEHVVKKYSVLMSLM